MALWPNDALLNIGATAMANASAYLSIHTATPNDTGSNESTAARKPITFSIAANGDVTITNGPIAFTGGAASGPAVAGGFWSAVTGGTYYGHRLLTGDQTFNAAGEYNVTAGALNGSTS